MYVAKALMFVFLLFTALILSDVAFFFGVHFSTDPLEGFSNSMQIVIYSFMWCNLILLCWFFYVFPANKIVSMEKPTFALIVLCLVVNIIHVVTSWLEVFDGYFESMVNMNYKMFGLIAMYLMIWRMAAKIKAR